MDFIKTLLLLFTLSFMSCSQVYAWDKTKSIGSPDLDFSSVFQVNTTDRGSIPCPKMTLAERDLIIAPTSGLCIYNTTTDSLENFNGIVWKKTGGGLSQWETATVYKIDDVVHETNKIYKALTDHTSGTFLTDLGNGDWVEISDDLNRELDGTVADKSLVIWDGTSGDNVLTSDILLDAGAFDFLQTTTPTNPIAGREKLYFKSDDKLYKLTNGGIESEVGASVSFLDDNRLLKSDTVGSDNLQQSGVVLNDTNDISGVNDIAANGIVTSQTPTISNFKEVGEKFKGDENYFSRGQSDYGLVADWVGANLTQDTTASNFLTGEFSVWKWTDTATISNQLVSQIINIPKGMRQSNIGYRFRYKYDGDDSDVDFLVQCVDDSRYIVADGDHKLNAYTTTDGSALATGDFSPSGCTQVKVLFKVQVANSGKNLFFDSVVVSPADRTVKTITETEVITYNSYLSRNGANDHKLSFEVTNTGRNLISLINVDHTRYTVLKKIDFVVSFSFTGGSSVVVHIGHYNSLNTLVNRSYSTSSANGVASLSLTGEANAGDYFIINGNVAGDPNSNHNFSITATADSDSVVRQTSSGDVDSFIQFNTGNGRGAVDTMIRRYANYRTSVSEAYASAISTTITTSGIKCTDTNNEGLVCEILEDGVYNISREEEKNIAGDAVFGVSVNSTLLTTGINALNPANVLSRITYRDVTGAIASVAGSYKLNKGDFIRPHNATTNLTNNDKIMFTISKAKVNPTVVIPFDDEYQNEFSARISNNGTAAVISDDFSGFIQSVSRTSIGTVLITFKPGWFSAAPAIFATIENVTAGRIINSSSLTASSVIMLTAHDAGGLTDFNFSIKASRQLSDVKNKTGFEVVRVAGTRTCIIEERTSPAIDGGTASALSVQVRKLNVAHGDCEFLTITLGTTGIDGTGNRFSLSKGKYIVDCSAPALAVNEHQLFLYSFTDSVTLDSQGKSAYSGSTLSVQTETSLKSSFTISSVKEYELHHFTATLRNTNGLGVSTADEVGNPLTYNVYSQCKIQKVR